MKRLIILLAVALIPLFGCKERKVTMADNGSTIDLVVGQVLKVELPSDASSGNTWRTFAYEDSVIIRKGKPNYMLGNDGIGGSGVYYFRFKAIGPGTSKLYMEYGNKFGDEEKPLRTFEITLNVHDPEDGK